MWNANGNSGYGVTAVTNQTPPLLLSPPHPLLLGQPEKVIVKVNGRLAWHRTTGTLFQIFCKFCAALRQVSSKTGFQFGDHLLFLRSIIYKGGVESGRYRYRYRSRSISL